MAASRALSAAWERVRSDGPLLVQRALAAAVAWYVARHVLGHDDPFFAPISAVVALNADLGERGSNALRLLLGVFVGITVGEATLGLIGGNVASLGAAVLVAMTLARALGGTRVTIAQASSGAILTVTATSGEVGPERLFDALIGAGVALLWSQFVFSPEPVSLLRRAESEALSDTAKDLELLASALEGDDARLDEEALRHLSDGHERLAEVKRLRGASVRVAQHSLVWRGQRTPLVRERESAAQLDLLVASCLLLARLSLVATPAQRRVMAPVARELSQVLAELSRRLGDQGARQAAADRALEIARRGGHPGDMNSASFDSALLMVRLAALDIMLFAGADATQAQAAIEQEDAPPQVLTPPQARRVPFARGQARK